MDVPIPTPRPVPPPPPEPALDPLAPPGAHAPGSPVLANPRSAQVALGVFAAVTLGLLAFRGYGNILGARPTDTAPPRPVVDLNRADRAELEQVPGIGPALATEIEADRRQKGPFRSVEELRRVKGVGPVTLDKVRTFLRVEPATASPESPIPEPLILERKPAPAPYPRTGGALKKLQPGDPPINVNVVSLDELMRLPGVGPVTAQNIAAARADKPFRSLADLDRVRNIGAKTLEKLRPFVVFE